MKYRGSHIALWGVSGPGIEEHMCKGPWGWRVLAVLEEKQEGVDRTPGRVEMRLGHVGFGEPSKGFRVFIPCMMGSHWRVSS